MPALRHHRLEGVQFVKVFGRMINLRNDPEKVADYIRYHAQVWPEVLEGLRSGGVTDMKIFLRGQRMFMYMTANDDYNPGKPSDSAHHPRVLEWDRIMRTLQERSPEATEEEWWAEMEIVFDMHWPQHL